MTLSRVLSDTCLQVPIISSWSKALINTEGLRQKTSLWIASIGYAYKMKHFLRDS